jgi:hypothetical protein
MTSANAMSGLFGRSPADALHPPTPRLPRIELPVIPLHTTQRGINKGAIFLDVEDRYQFMYPLCTGASAPRIAPYVSTEVVTWKSRAACRETVDTFRRDECRTGAP